MPATSPAPRVPTSDSTGPMSSTATPATVMTDAVSLAHEQECGGDHGRGGERPGPRRGAEPLEAGARRRADRVARSARD